MKNKNPLNWSLVSQMMKKQNFNRNTQQCRERYLKFLNPERFKQAFTVEENKKIINLYEQLGNHWTEIA